MSERGRPPSAPARRSSAYDDAVRYLGPRPRSTLEIRRHLMKRRHDEKEIELALARLREQGYVDDRAFARYWLEQRASFRPKGDVALRSELAAKGIDAAIVEEVLAGDESPGESAAARSALAPRLPRWRELDVRERKARAQAFLRRRGFSFDTIEEVLAGLEE